MHISHSPCRHLTRGLSLERLAEVLSYHLSRPSKSTALRVLVPWSPAACHHSTLKDLTFDGGILVPMNNNLFAVVVAPASFAQPGIAATISEVQQQSLGSTNGTPTNAYHAPCRGYIEAPRSDALKQEDNASLPQDAGFDCHGGIISPKRRTRRRNLSKEQQSCNFFMIRELLFDDNYMDISYGCLGTRVHDTPQPVPQRNAEGVGTPTTVQQPVDYEPSPPIHLCTYMPSPQRDRSRGKAAMVNPTPLHTDGVSNSVHPSSPTPFPADDDSAFVDSLYNSPFICSYDTCCSFERVYDTLVQWCDDTPFCGKSSYTPPTVCRA